ncbi:MULTISPECIES: DNA cytosine methyltransferase [Luteimonas]|uniref:DNA cytosine methyltransferase n=1 Tax=Luteimonas TaxID=83614 RepID=UPI000C7E1A15|nr:MULTISPECIES: DNA cytosine methyltransferase [Luteimonas]
MADGSRQIEFNIPRRPLVSALLAGEIIVDLFAGGGGASEALKQALGRDPDIAINHDRLAIGMHAANHPLTRHLREDVWQADPRIETWGRPVGWFHASPDCTHFSQAKGGQPRDRATRSLSWVVLKWAGMLARAGNAPRIISLENVEQILKWGPLVAKRDKATGRVVTLEKIPDPATGKLVHRVAAVGEQVPLRNQFLTPDTRHAGRTWRQFVAALRGLGYTVEWRKLIASDHGAGTSRKRLFLVARRDGVPVMWPAPSHGKAPGLLPLVTAADCIDWSLPCPSIFTRKKPLADNTHRRIARGIKRFVLDAEEPYIVPASALGATNEARHVHRRDLERAKRDPHGRTQPHREVGRERNGASVPQVLDDGRLRGLSDAPVDDACDLCARGDDAPGTGRGPTAASAPGLRGVGALITEHANASRSATWRADEPLRTQCANVKGGHFALIAPTLIQAAHGEGKPGGVQRWGSGCKAADDPLGVVTATASGGHAVAAAHLVKFRGDSSGVAANDPMPTITSGAGAARPAGAAHAMGVAAATLVQTGYGEREGQAPRVPHLDKPVGTLVDGVKHAVVTAFLEQAAGGPNSNTSPPRSARDPVSTITQSGSQQRLVTANMVTMRGDNIGAEANDPVRTMSAGGEHHAVVECTLSPEHEASALRVAAFLVKYYGTALGVDLRDPLDTVTTRDRLALVTVMVRGTPYVIVDIGLRMLRPHELYRAQGFPADYIIDRTADGTPITTTAAVRMVGNSVSPPPLRAIALANTAPQQIEEALAA